MAGKYDPNAEYVAEFLDDNEGEFQTNEIRSFLSTKPGRSPTNGINNMLIDLSPEYVEPVKYQGTNHIWNKTREDPEISDLEDSLNLSYPNTHLTSTKFRSKLQK